MHEQNRLKLLFGPYRMLRCKVGGLLRCATRGKVKVRSIHEAPIQWPCTTWDSLILCGDLVRAVRRESEIAVAHWWGVSEQTVWKWRTTLGVPATTKGTSNLRSRWAPETVQSDEANAKRAPTLKSPERAAKIAAARRGKPRPQQVIEALRKANKGRVPSEETRAKMRQAALNHGAYPPAAGPPWSTEDVALLGTMTDRQVAERTGRTQEAVSEYRANHHIPAFRAQAEHHEPIKWTKFKDSLLGTMSDAKLALKLGCTQAMVRNRRNKLRIAAFEKLAR